MYRENYHDKITEVLVFWVVVAKDEKNYELFKVDIYQSKGPEHWQAFYICQAQLHKTEADNNAIEDVPALLEVVVRIQSNNFEAHLCCEDASEHLWKRKSTTVAKNTVRAAF